MVLALALILLSGGVCLNPGPVERNLQDIPCSCGLQPVLGSANICGLRSKVANLQAEYLVPYGFGSFSLQETKLFPSCQDPLLQVPDYTSFHKDRSGSEGGVALYVQNSLNPWQFRSQIPAPLELVRDPPPCAGR